MRKPTNDRRAHWTKLGTRVKSAVGVGEDELGAAKSLPF